MSHKRNWWIVMAFILFSVACSENKNETNAEDGLDAAREFVRAVLDADYIKAEQYILNDEEDIKLFKSYTDYMKKRPSNEISALKQSNIIINNVQNQGDSVEIINYANTYSKEPTDIKVIRKNDQWYVDFSFTISGKSAPHK